MPPLTTPPSDCEVHDPRIRRTRQSLHAALYALMHTRRFDDISVAEIADTAGVNRATFYDHYADKYALLEASVASGFHQLLAQRNIRYDGTCPSAAHALILAACDFLTRMHGDSATCERQSAFQPLVDAALTAAICRVLAEGMSVSDNPAALPAPVRAASVSAAIYGAVKAWASGSHPVPAETIAPLILALILPLLS